MNPENQYQAEYMPAVQPEVQAYQPSILQLLTEPQKAREMTDNMVITEDGTQLYFNQNLKISHGQKKQLTAVLFKNTGMKIAGSEQTFDYPEVFLENIETQKETLVMIFWNTEQYWRTAGNQGNYWHARPAHLLDADMVEFMFEQIQERVDPLKTKQQIEKAKNQANESR